MDRKHLRVVIPILARFVCQMGDWLFFVIASQETYERYQSTLLVGFLAILRMLPSVILSPLSARFVCRFNPWRFMAVIDGLRGLILYAVILSPSSIAVLLVSLLLACLDSIYSIAYRSAIPTLVAPSNLMRVNTLRQSLGSVSLTVGPALAGLTISRFGTASSILINSACFWICGATMLAVYSSASRSNLTEVNAEKRNNHVGGLLTDYQIALGSRVLRTFIVAAFIAGIGNGCFNYLIVYANEILGGRESVFGIMTSGMGLGGIASLGILLLPISKLDSFVVYGIAALADGICLGSLARWNLGILGTAAVLFLSGSNDSLAGAASETVLHAYAPDGYSAHVFAIDASASRLASVIGILVFGKLADAFGITVSFCVAGCLLALSGGISCQAKLLRRRRVGAEQ